MESAAKNRSGRSHRRITVMKGWAHTLGSLSMFTQLGLSLAAPLLLCVYIFLICQFFNTFCFESYTNFFRLFPDLVPPSVTF